MIYIKLWYLPFVAVDHIVLLYDGFLLSYINELVDISCLIYYRLSGGLFVMYV